MAFRLRTTSQGTTRLPASYAASCRPLLNVRRTLLLTAAVAEVVKWHRCKLSMGACRCLALGHHPAQPARADGTASYLLVTCLTMTGQLLGLNCLSTAWELLVNSLASTPADCWCPCPAGACCGQLRMDRALWRSHSCWPGLQRDLLLLERDPQAPGAVSFDGQGPLALSQLLAWPSA